MSLAHTTYRSDRGKKHHKNHHRSKSSKHGHHKGKHRDDKDRRRKKDVRNKKDSFDKLPINDMERINKSKRDYMPEGFKARVINEEPYIVKIKNFLTNEEADELIDLAYESGFERSNMVIDNELVIDNNRTSQTAYLLDDGCPYTYSDNIENLIKRVCYLLRCKRSQIEGLMCVKYKGGEYFETHVDFFSSDDSKLLDDGGNRIFTFFVYLNTLEKGEGGQTEFPELGVRSRPIKTDAVGWFNEVRGEMQRDTLHRGLPPKNGAVKYGLNIWIRKPGW